jgi:hypothetical protein
VRKIKKLSLKAFVFRRAEGVSLSEKKLEKDVIGLKIHTQKEYYSILATSCHNKIVSALNDRN